MPAGRARIGRQPRKPPVSRPVGPLAPYVEPPVGGDHLRVKTAGTFTAAEKTKYKSGGTFALKPVKIKVGGTFV